MNDSDSKNCEDLKGLQSVPRGFLRLLIARLLRNRELTGTQIMGVIEERSKGKWRPSPGSIYPLLSSMEDEELIEAVKTEGRSKTYTLSVIGHNRFKEIFKHTNLVNASGIYKISKHIFNLYPAFNTSKQLLTWRLTLRIQAMPRKPC